MNRSVYLNRINNNGFKKPESAASIYCNGLVLNFKSAVNDVAEIDIDGAIGWDLIKWLEDEEQNTQENIKKKLREIDASEIIVNINSLGGFVNDGLVIHDYLQEHPAKVTTVARGLVASAGTIILQGGHRKMSANSRILIHKAMAGICGWFNSNELQSIINDNDGMDETISKLYAANGNKSADDYLELMNEENGAGIWLSADEAKEWGLIDEVYQPADGENAANKRNYSAGAFQNAGFPVPEGFNAEGAEDAQRSQGFKDSVFRIQDPEEPAIKPLAVLDSDNNMLEVYLDGLPAGAAENIIKNFNIEENDSDESVEDVPLEGMSLEEAVNMQIELQTK